MSFEVMLQQLAAGFGQTCAIFALTLIFSLPLGLLVYFGRNTKVETHQLAGEDLYFHHAGNSADAAASDLVLLPLFSSGG